MNFLPQSDTQLLADYKKARLEANVLGRELLNRGYRIRINGMNCNNPVMMTEDQISISL